MQDFSEKIKHLRLIHFSLLIVSVVLLISEEIDEESKAVQAYNQIVAIREASEKWNTINLETNVQARFKLGDEFRRSNLHIILKPIEERAEPGVQRSFWFLKQYINKETGLVEIITTAEKSPQWTLSQKDGSFISHYELDRLINFKRLWKNYLMKPRYVYALEPDSGGFVEYKNAYGKRAAEGFRALKYLKEWKLVSLGSQKELFLGCEKPKVDGLRSHFISGKTGMDITPSSAQSEPKGRYSHILKRVVGIRIGVRNHLWWSASQGRCWLSAGFLAFLVSPRVSPLFRLPRSRTPQ